MKEIKTEQELKQVLELCYRILGENNSELYGYSAWKERLQDGLQPLVYAVEDDKIVSAVLGGQKTATALWSDLLPVTKITADGVLPKI